jgi:putative flippase GtrA
VLFLWLFPHGAAGYLGALVYAHIAAVLCAFVLYRRFVFRVTGHVLRDLARFDLVNLSALGFNLAALPLLVEMFGLAGATFPAGRRGRDRGVQLVCSSWFLASP